MLTPRGIICAWSGALVDIPAGWLVCDGTLGTPDLQERFIVGAGLTYNPGDTGGTITHDHTFTSDGHFHLLAGGGILGGPTGYNPNTDVSVATGRTDLHDNLPPYHALFFIMKS